MSDPPGQLVLPIEEPRKMKDFYNLLRENWIPARYQGGELRWIAPHQIVDPSNPPLVIDSGRPDLDGALVQFLIALLQTAAAPADERAWRGWLTRPPSAEELQKRFATYEDAFYLDGTGPRYMQELNFPLTDATETDKKGKPKPPKVLEPCPIAWLLMDAPTDNAIELNKDLFIKRDRVECLSYPAIAMALTTLQMNASGGGPGYRTSLRGGGPLTTLVDINRAPLWVRLWMNVLPRSVFESRGGNPSLTNPAHIFPWMGPTRISNDENAVTTTEHVHPAHQFWAMPWRIWIDFDGETGRCSVLDVPEGPVVQRFYKRNYGFNYKGAWRHPLTPYQAGKQGDYARTVGGDGIPYRDWPALCLGDSQQQLPARVVEVFLGEQRGLVDARWKGQQRLHAFGYEMDNAKARCWFDRTTPLFDIKPELARALYPETSRLVLAAQNVLFTLRQQVKRAVKRRPEDAKKDIPEITPSFWAETEADFFKACEQLAAALSQGRDHAEIREQWLTTIHRAALAIFKRHSQESAVFSATDVRRVALAHNDLVKFTHPSGKKIRELVSLPVKESAGEGATAGKSPRKKKAKE